MESKKVNADTNIPLKIAFLNPKSFAYQIDVAIKQLFSRHFVINPALAATNANKSKIS